MKKTFVVLLGGDVWTAAKLDQLIRIIMDANASAKWVIIWLSLQITGLSMFVTKQAYDLGYERGRIKVLTTWQSDVDGTCLAEKGGCDEYVKNK